MSAGGLAVPAERQGYRPSDCDLEEALADRSGFRRFCGFDLEDAAPLPASASTWWRQVRPKPSWTCNSGGAAWSSRSAR
ncbi:transposase [Geminicoccus sp.]|uniref:transposase n=1 Tax=Geminicoccus sp. TaxID=2024832 RepID=UPI0039C89EAC